MGKFTYHYNASALGLGGVLTDDRDATTIVPSLASVALAPTGGEGFIEVTNYNKDGVSFSNASSHIVGYDTAYRTFTTNSDVYITNLNLFGRVKVAILQTSISSTREVLESGEMTTESNPDKACFSMHSMIRGLTIDGVEVIPQFDLDLVESPTYEQFTTKIGGARERYAEQFGVTTDELQKVLEAKTEPICASFVNALQYKEARTLGPRQGCRLPVKNFGTIHFGELVVKPGTRRVNLLRFVFDSTLTFDDRMLVNPTVLFGSTADSDLTSSSPLKGTMTVISEHSNGAPSWP